MTETDFVFKVIIIGNAGTGKSSLLLRFCDNTFTDNYYATIGVDFKIKTVNLENSKTVKLQIYDTAGQERFHTITSSYYHSADGIAIVYDITNRESFDAVSAWEADVEKMARPEACKILIANKTDLHGVRTVSQQEGQDLAKSLGVPFIETSAKSSENVDLMFLNMAKEMKERKEKASFTDIPQSSVNLRGKAIGESSCYYC